MRCASKIKSPCWQILSVAWQITRVFDEEAPATASPSSVLQRQHRNFGLGVVGRQLTRISEDHNRADLCHGASWQHCGSVVDQLPTLGVAGHDEFGVGTCLQRVRNQSCPEYFQKPFIMRNCVGKFTLPDCQ